MNQSFLREKNVWKLTELLSHSQTLTLSASCHAQLLRLTKTISPSSPLSPESRRANLRLAVRRLLLRTSTRLYHRRRVGPSDCHFLSKWFRVNDRNQLFIIFINLPLSTIIMNHACHFVKKMKESYYSYTMTMVNSNLNPSIW